MADSSCHIGRHHRRLLLQAGFARVEASSSVWSAGSSEETTAYADFLRAQLQGGVPKALEEGWVN
ncbi:MAG TPA: hypothetical protein VKT80_06675, partial [Chloroflexota bacterium]|nr:hypothetical protein [Chloroflexota bacterium]